MVIANCLNGLRFYCGFVKMTIFYFRIGCSFGMFRSSAGGWFRWTGYFIVVMARTYCCCVEGVLVGGRILSEVLCGVLFG